MTARLRRKVTWGGRVLLAAWLVGSLGGPAAAQSLDPGRAFRGLFVPNTAGTSGSLTTDVYQGVNRGTTDTSGSSIYDRGTFTGVTGNFVVEHVGQYTSYSANAFGMARYFADTGNVRSLFHGGAIGMRHHGRRIAIELQQQLSQQPALVFGNLRGLVTQALGSLGSVTPDHGADGYGLFTSASSVALGLQSRRRQWLSLGYRYAYSRISRSDESLPAPSDTAFQAQDISLRATHQFWKNTGVRFDVNASRGGFQQLGARQGVWIYSFNASLDKMQSVSLTRTTTLSFGGGASVLEDRRGQRYVFIGTGGVDKKMGRHARASFGARRDVQFVEGLADPVLTNGLVMDVQAQPGRRWNLGARGLASRGRIALGALGGDIAYSSYGFDARVRVRVAGPIAAYAEYLNFQQDFNATENPFLLGRPVNRDGIRVGVVIGVPLFGQRGVE